MNILHSEQLALAFLRQLDLVVRRDQNIRARSPIVSELFSHYIFRVSLDLRLLADHQLLIFEGKRPSDHKRTRRSDDELLTLKMELEGTTRLGWTGEYHMVDVEFRRSKVNVSSHSLRVPIGEPKLNLLAIVFPQCFFKPWKKKDHSLHVFNY